MSESNPGESSKPDPIPAEIVDPRESDVREGLRQSITGLWWLMLLRGVTLVVLGVYAMIRPGMATEIVIQVLGIFLIVDGVFVLIAGITGDYPSRTWIIVRGIVSILVGVLVFAHPVAVGVVAAKFILYLIAFGAVITGLFEVMSAIADRKRIEGEGWLILSGVLAILFGVMIFMAPLLFAKFFVQILGVFALIYGISLIAMAMRVRKIGRALGT